MELSIINAINSQCHCNFNSSQITSAKVLCNTAVPYYPTYRAVLTDLAQYSASSLAYYVENWVHQGPAVTNGLAVFTIDSTCPVYPESTEDLPCGDEEKDDTYSATVLVGSLIAEFVILMVIFCVVLAIILGVFSSKLKKQR